MGKRFEVTTTGLCSMCGRRPDEVFRMLFHPDAPDKRVCSICVRLADELLKGKQ